MGFELQAIERVRGIDRKTFMEKYYKPRIAVIIEDFAADWPATTKWTFDYMREVVGNREVPLYDDSKVDYTKKVNEPAAKMMFGDYLDLLQREPTNLRIFLFNIFKHVPALTHDFSPPALAPDILTSFPMMFFGGQNSHVFLHYDLDLSHVFHTHFNGRKRTILFDQKYSKQLYRIPWAVHNVEDIDIENPDFDRWPALRGVKGYDAILEHGETLFMPSGMWHYMKYLDGSFSLSLRAMDKSLATKAHGLYNVTLMRYIDNLARKIGGKNWIEYKDRRAVELANRTIR